MKFLIITEDAVLRIASGTEAAIACGRPIWDCATLASQFNALNPGDCAKMGSNYVYRLSGSIVEV